MPLQLFTFAANKDQPFLAELENHLKPLGNLVSLWHPGKILPSANINKQINDVFFASQILLPLLSSDLLKEHEDLYQRSCLRAKNDGILLVPIRLRPSLLESNDTEGVLILPRSGKAITQYGNPDEAWTEIASEVQALALSRSGAASAAAAPVAVRPSDVGGISKTAPATRARLRTILVLATLCCTVLAVVAYFTVPQIPADMVRLPGGPFTLVDPFRDAREIPPYAIDRTEVRRADYFAWLHKRKARFERQGSQGYFHDEDGELLLSTGSAYFGKYADPKMPITGVHRLAASRYCLSLGKRLPRYAEWDLAARSQNQLLRYPWGEAPPTCDGVTFGKGGPGESATCGEPEAPRQVGTSMQDRNAHGVLDLAGNVSEWVDTAGSAGYLRGGSFLKGAESTRTDYYVATPADRAYVDAGFRCARDLTWFERIWPWP